MASGPHVDLIIPTWNNPGYLQSCLNSLAINRATEDLYHVYVVNNGHQNSCDWVEGPLFTVLQAGGKLRMGRWIKTRAGAEQSAFCVLFK